MKHAIVGLTALCSVVCLTLAPHAEARGIRADIPSPYGCGGGTWSPAAGAPTSPYNPGDITPNSATLTSGPNTDDLGTYGAFSPLSASSATMYLWYSSPIPSVAVCSPPNPTSPIEQVMVYNLESYSQSSDNNSVLLNGNTVQLPVGDTEVEFNYALSGATGQASFKMGGVTYTSNGIIPVNTDNDFLFNSNGSLAGALGVDSNGNVIVTSGLPSGWSATSGTVSAPEIDPASAFGALTLLAGCLAVMQGGRRTIGVSTI